jgi:rifampicin phosphotransferase
LKNISKQDSDRVGAKGANLGELIKAGFPVPEGFVLVVDAYKCFVSHNNIDASIDHFLNALNGDDYENVASTSLKIQNLFKQAEIPLDIAAELDNAYSQLGFSEVAVRSSANAEDLPGTSFAGQYETYLNVKGREQLCQATKMCWASLWNDRALLYRLKHRILGHGLAQGVIVQRLINSEKSGIIFTANPINSRRDQVVVNASWGLGEAVVDGVVTPDQWKVDKKKHLILDEKIADKEIMTTRSQNGTELIAVAKDMVKQASLSPKEVLELSKYGMSIEKHFGCPQDIEWAFFKEDYFITQSRPITSLFPLPEQEDNDDRLRIYINFLMSNQATHEPLTSLGLDMWRRALISIVFKRKYLDTCSSWIKTAAGRLFIDVTEFSRIEKWWKYLLNNPSDMDPTTTRVMLQVVTRDMAELSAQRKSLFKSAPGFLIRLNLSLIKFIITSMPKAMYGALFPPEKTVTKAYEYGNKKIEALEKKALKLETFEEKLEFVEKEAASIFYFIPLSILFYVMISLIHIDKARTIITKHLDSHFELNKVERAVPNSVTTEMGMELLHIAKKLHTSAEEPGIRQQDVKTFLTKYGHRSCQEIDIGVPRWQEEPQYVIDLIQTYINQNSYEQAIEKFQKDMVDAEKAIKIIVNQLYEKGAKRDAKRVEKLLINYRKMFGAREYPKFIMSKGVGIFRKVFLDIGETFQKDGKLDLKQDIFFVTLAQIKSCRKLHKFVENNKKIYQEELLRNPVPRVITSTGEVISSVLEERKNHEFSGIPVSPGAFTGPVRILNHPGEGSELKPGDILVTKSTNPAWTPLFLNIGGLIMETGGPISHGSVVAREYGVPAIAGVKDATKRFQNGQRIRINGETGIIDCINPYAK